MAGAAIQVEGLDEVLAALKTIDPNLRKGATQRIRKVPAEVQKITKSRVPARPMRNWGSWSRQGGKDNFGRTSYANVGALRWDQAAVKSGIRLLTGGKRLNVRLINQSAPGSVFEMAGTRGGKTLQGERFAANLRAFGIAPRLLIHTWREEKGIKRTASEIGKVARFAEEEVKRRIA